jgi:PPM family protein phosphatase
MSSTEETGVSQVGDSDREVTAKVNSQELIAEWEERARKAQEVRVISMLGARTDLGRVRDNNEDKYEFFQPEDPDVLANKGSLYAVADGMGGHSAGQIASELALKTAIKAYYADDSPLLEESLRAAVQQANALVYDTAQAVADRAGMGTTLTVLVIRGEEAFIAQVGDSRLYALRDSTITQVTDDHSWVNEQVKWGGMTEREAMLSPYRNVITRSVGNASTVEVDIFYRDLMPGDVFLLCSDGVSGLVGPEQMRKAMSEKSPSQAAWDLVDMALDAGGHDNATVLVLAVRDIVGEKKAKRTGFAALFGKG